MSHVLHHCTSAVCTVMYVQHEHESSLQVSMIPGALTESEFRSKKAGARGSDVVCYWCAPKAAANFLWQFFRRSLAANKCRTRHCKTSCGRGGVPGVRQDSQARHPAGLDGVFVDGTVLIICTACLQHCWLPELSNCESLAGRRLASLQHAWQHHGVGAEPLHNRVMCAL
jgi:hypothetical protein